MNRRMAALGIVSLAGAAATAARAQDARGSADHPLLTRYPGSVIRWYDVQAHQPYRVAVGPVTGYRQIGRWLDIEGRLTRIYYELRGRNTHGEVYGNYKRALQSAGFELVSDGFQPQASQAAAIGSRNWLNIAYAANAFPPSVNIELLSGSSTAGGTAFLAGRKQTGRATAYVAVGIAQQQADRVLYVVDVIETGAMQTGLVSVADLAAGIDAKGKVVLGGLFFDNDRTTLRPESQPALAEIAAFLKSRPALNCFVVGHTDMNGTLAHNMTLSLGRARAVVAALIGLGVPASRLEAQGVGPLSPAATNRAESGRAENRRVELVAR